jgi:outer membrane lipoprotein-sorting protein
MKKIILPLTILFLLILGILVYQATRPEIVPSQIQEDLQKLKDFSKQMHDNSPIQHVEPNEDKG